MSGLYTLGRRPQFDMTCRDNSNFNEPNESSFFKDLVSNVRPANTGSTPRDNNHSMIRERKASITNMVDDRSRI